MDGRVRTVVLSLSVALFSLEAYMVLSARAEARDAQIIAAEAEAAVNEPLRLRRKWGPKQYSWHNEELFIREFFQDRRGGVFLDVGAYHFSRNSNTYFLEKNLGWTGIAIDAQEEYREGYQTNRAGTKFFTYFVSDVSGDEADLSSTIRPECGRRGIRKRPQRVARSLRWWCRRSRWTIS